MRARRRVTTAVASLLATLAALVVAGAACRQLVGIGDEPPTGVVDAGTKSDASEDAGAACGIAYAGASCEQCLEHDCCRQLAACSGVPECRAFETCAGACEGGPECRARCFQAHRSGADPTILALESCLAGSCVDACGITCGGVAQFAAVDAGASCQTCFEAHGCSAAIECLRNPDCSAYQYCIVTAPTPDIQNACTIPDGGFGIDAGDLSSVADHECLTACGLDSNWSCLGHVEWPPPVNRGFTLELKLFDVEAPFIKQVSGVTAKLCADATCNPPGAVAQSDMYGNVTLTATGGSGNYFNGYVDFSDGGIVPTLFYWSFPISQNLAILNGQFDQIPTVASQNIGQILPVAWDASATGIVAFTALDCYQVAAAGVAFTISPAASPNSAFYQGENTTSVVPGLTATTSAGFGYFVNVPAPSVATLTATVPPSTTPIGQYGVLVRPGTATFVLALPTP
jgi:hypothetical protein